MSKLKTAYCDDLNAAHDVAWNRIELQGRNKHACRLDKSE
jgi:hypothetical protein